VFIITHIFCAYNYKSVTILLQSGYIGQARGAPERPEGAFRHMAAAQPPHALFQLRSNKARRARELAASANRGV